MPARSLYTDRMSMSPASLRVGLVPVLVGSVALGGCKDNYEMVTAALDSVSVSEGLSTAGLTETTGAATETTGEPTTGTPTTGTPTTGATNPTTTTNTTNPTTTTTNTTNTTEATTQAETGWDPSETTGPPATCDGPQECTGEGMGEFGPVVMPFFRGEVCVSDKLRPKDMLAISFSPCIHPCLTPGTYGWRYIVRCVNTQGCEIGFMLYYDEAAGKNCPSDVFYKFDPALCKYPASPHKALTQPLMGLGSPGDQVLIPFLTNADTAAMLTETPTEVWTRLDGYVQGDDRRFPLDVDANHPAPPTECGPGIAGCTCKQIGF